MINGLTCRIGRAIFGTISIIRDLLESDQSILMLGKPGVGKTTIIREIARVLSDEMGKRVIIVDTSNEIAGNSDIPHSGIGRARRMQVAQTEFQHQVMIEAVENHMPQVIIIDEIGTELETLAARTIAEKGVQLVGTTHGNCLQNLIKNPFLSDLIGGIQYVTLSDDEAKRRKTQKSILERKASSTFQTVIEINNYNSWTIHENLEYSIDCLLRSQSLSSQTRCLKFNTWVFIKYKFFRPLISYSKFDSSNSSLIVTKNWKSPSNLIFLASPYSKAKNLILYTYCLSNNLIKEVLAKMGSKILLTKQLEKASLIIGLKTNLQQNNKICLLARQKKVPIFMIKENNLYQIIKLIQFILL